eukprot:scaffold15313_cov132-Isochrysis_galbana.AAC.2
MACARDPSAINRRNLARPPALSSSASSSASAASSPAPPTGPCALPSAHTLAPPTVGAAPPAPTPRPPPTSSAESIWTMACRCASSSIAPPSPDSSPLDSSAPLESSPMLAPPLAPPPHVPPTPLRSAEHAASGMADSLSKRRSVRAISRRCSAVERVALSSRVASSS